MGVGGPDAQSKGRWQRGSVRPPDTGNEQRRDLGVLAAKRLNDLMVGDGLGWGRQMSEGTPAVSRLPRRCRHKLGLACCSIGSIGAT